MKIKVIPNKGLIIDKKEFNWGDNRFTLREYLKNQHKEDDNIFNMSEFFEGDTSYDIIQKRDIYHNINNSKNYFFLNYDNEEKLDSLEVHEGIIISINNTELSFEKDIDENFKLLKSIDASCKIIEDGNFLFVNLKITIANSESMRGNGNRLSYFFTSRSIEHLIEN